eukprot:217224_1
MISTENVEDEAVSGNTKQLSPDKENEPLTKLESISIHIPDADSSPSKKSKKSKKKSHKLPQTPSNLAKINGRKRRYSYPLIYTQKHCDTHDQYGAERRASLGIFDDENHEILTPQRVQFACHKADKKMFSKTHSILKLPGSPRSPFPKKVQFADEIQSQKRVSLWYHIDSPKGGRKPASTSHTKEGSVFSCDMDDPSDRGPLYNPNPVMLGDYDYTHDDDADEEESIWDYCCTLL